MAAGLRITPRLSLDANPIRLRERVAPRSICIELPSPLARRGFLGHWESEREKGPEHFEGARSG
jgi:hypothetical protein